MQNEEEKSIIIIISRKSSRKRAIYWRRIDVPRQPVKYGKSLTHIIRWEGEREEGRGRRREGGREREESENEQRMEKGKDGGRGRGQCWRSRGNEGKREEKTRIWLRENDNGT